MLICHFLEPKGYGQLIPLVFARRGDALVKYLTLDFRIGVKLRLVLPQQAGIVYKRLRFIKQGLIGLDHLHYLPKLSIFSELWFLMN